jgi:hypothetical protein
MFDFYTNTLKKIKIKKSNKKQRCIFSLVSYFPKSKISFFCQDIEKEKKFINDNSLNNNITLYQIKDNEDFYDDFISIIDKEKDDCIIIFDGIYKNDKNYLSWQKIKQEKRVFVCIDFYFLGIVIKNSRFKDKQNYILKNH